MNGIPVADLEFFFLFSSRMKLGGYFMSFGYKFAEHLHIDVEGTEWDNHHIEWPIDN